MSEPLLNRLLDEATSRATELAGEADEASAAAQALGRRAEALRDLLSSRGDDVLRRYRELATSCAEAEAAVGAAGDEAGRALGDLDQRAAHLRTRIGEALASARADLAELAQAAEAQNSATSEAVEESCAGLAQAESRAREVERELEAQLTEAEAEIAEFHRSVESARTTFEEATDEFHGALARAGEASAAQAQAQADAVAALIANVDDVHAAVEAFMYMASERCGAALARAFLLVIPEGARATYASLTGALEAVKVHCEVREAELEAGVSVAAENKVRMTVALTPPWPTFGAAAGLQG